MERPASATSCPPPMDFERASLAWVTKDGSHGRWRVIACTTSWSPLLGAHDRFVLSPRIMAGDVYGAGKLPLDPPYGFQIIASAERHVIIRDFEGDLSSRDSSNRNLEIFSKLSIEAPLLDTVRVDGDLLTPKSLPRSWPLTARLRISNGGVEHLIAFPVLHLNTKEGGVFQVETGPVLLPSALTDDPALSMDGFALVFVFFNRLDRVDLAIWGPARAGAARRGYVHFARRDGIVIELYGGKSA